MIVAEADSPANRDVIGAAVGLEAALLKSGAETPLRLGLLPGLLAPGLVAGVEVRDLELELPSEAEDLRGRRLTTWPPWGGTSSGPCSSACWRP